MKTLTPKKYQDLVLNSVGTYFDSCHEHGSPAVAFQLTTEQLWGRPSLYRPLTGFANDMPYFCLRVPTGGGKTRIAARSVAILNKRLLRTEHSVVLWLVPSNAIRDQTLRALRDREHAYHHDLRVAGPIAVMDLEEAKAITRSTLETSTVIIVATHQAFNVEDKGDRKVYESSGALMHHFDDLADAQRAGLPQAEDGTVPYSLANVLRLRRPFLIVDEAHNNRTELSFGTLAGFDPSGILELTATPDTEKTPSNVLHSVSAAELKAEEMIKLPILLEPVPDWQKCLAYGIDRREQLHEVARREHAEGAPYLRPLVLIQAQPRRKGVETLDVGTVKDELIRNHNIPEEEIVIATGDERGLDGIEEEYEGGLFSERCPVKYIVTQQALAEGWDCPFAYILVSLAELKNDKAVEQLLGRVLRQPGAKQRENEALNRSYAYVVSSNFSAVAKTLRDRLVEGAGFERQEAVDFVRAGREEQRKLDLEGNRGRIVITPVVVPLPEELPVRKLPRDVKKKIDWDKKTNELTINEPLSEEETAVVRDALVMDASRDAVEKAGEASRTDAVEIFSTPSELGLDFPVPQLAVEVNGELQLFDDPDVLDYPWDLPAYASDPTPEEISALELISKVSGAGEIDVDEESGRVVTRFLSELERDLGFSYRPEHWDEAKLAAWLCRNLPDPYTTHASKRAFVSAWLSRLLAKEGFDLARANRQKFLLRKLLEDRIRDLRREAVGQAYQEFLFSEGNEDRVGVGTEFTFHFHPDAYAPDRDYDGRYGEYQFRHHYYPRIGDFDGEEEYLLACHLDGLAAKGQIQFWVRNLVRKAGSSFFLQTATGRFYPDFVCLLPDDVVLAVENKGGHLWKDAEEDRKIGELWAEMSSGKCRFVMVKDKKWEWVDPLL